jgi:hypothetical protein
MTSVRQCVAVRCQCVNALAGCECVSASVRYWMTHTHTHTQHALGEVESVSVRQCVSATPCGQPTTPTPSRRGGTQRSSTNARKCGMPTTSHPPARRAPEPIPNSSRWRCPCTARSARPSLASAASPGCPAAITSPVRTRPCGAAVGSGTTPWRRSDHYPRVVIPTTSPSRGGPSPVARPETCPDTIPENRAHPCKD